MKKIATILSVAVIAALTAAAASSTAKPPALRLKEHTSSTRQKRL